MNCQAQRFRQHGDHRHPLPPWPRWEVAVVVAGIPETTLELSKTERIHMELTIYHKNSRDGACSVMLSLDSSQSVAGKWLSPVEPELPDVCFLFGCPGAATRWCWLLQEKRRGMQVVYSPVSPPTSAGVRGFSYSSDQ